MQNQVSASQVDPRGYLSRLREARVMKDRSAINVLQCTESHCHQEMRSPDPCVRPAAPQRGFERDRYGDMHKDECLGRRNSCQ